MKNAFSAFHPFVNFLYFIFVIGFSMFLMNPVCLAVALLSAMTYSIYLNGRKSLKFNVLYMLPLMAFTALLNPAFNHEGITILSYLPDGNPLTLESIQFGIAAAVMLVTVISWFSCFNMIMTSDKFVFLFGRIIPALSLVLSMTLRFVPRFNKHLKEVSAAQKCIGKSTASGGILKRARSGMTTISAMVTWALENAIETSDSMRGRGYGLPGRTAYSIFKMEPRDKAALAAIGAFGGYVLAGVISGAVKWLYFPYASGRISGAYTISVFAAYLLLCMLPVIIEITEDRKWKHLRSGI